MDDTRQGNPGGAGLISRARLVLFGAVGLLFVMSVGAWAWSYARPYYIIQDLQTLPASMQARPPLPAGTWHGSHRRWIALAGGKFSGEVGSWWDRVPPPTSPSQMLGMGGRSGVGQYSQVYFRTVPGAFNSAGVATGKVVEWVVPLWLPTLLSGGVLLVLAFPELFLAVTFHGRRRRRMGRCVKCGYDLFGLGKEACCPECGTSPKHGNNSGHGPSGASPVPR